MIRSLSKNSSCLAPLACVLAFVLLAAGCKKKEPLLQLPLPARSAQPKPDSAQNAAQKQMSSTVALPPATASQFDFSAKKDPFKPFVSIKTPQTNNVGAANKSSLPIHSYDVRQFRLIGVVSGAKGSQAMVVDPDGKGYVLKTGMTIGKNNGKVQAIASNGVEVLEQFKDDSGRVRKERIKITLPRKQ